MIESISKWLRDNLNESLRDTHPTFIGNTTIYTTSENRIIYAIYVTADAVFDTGTDWNLRGSDPIAAGTIFLAGSIIYVNAEAVKLVSGSVITYERLA